ncbi:unnamed protein product [Chrysoparadoxa australica]
MQDDVAQVNDGADADALQSEKYVHGIWEKLCDHCGCGGVVASKWWGIIRGRYGEWHRHYHTLEHLEDMLTGLDYFCESLNRPDVVQLAIFFHDIVYEPRSRKNEADSAVLFQQVRAVNFAGEAGLNPEDAQLVVDYILATEKHIAGPNAEADLKVLLDLDMAVTGKSPAVYMDYARKIRHEYIHVPLETYCAKRAEVLEIMLQAERIFATEEFCNLLEKAARSNMAGEIRMLKEGEVPGILKETVAQADQDQSKSVAI